MRRFHHRILLLSASVATGGACFQFGCVGGVGSVLNSFNPCGTIFNCDARLYQFVTSGIDGPGVRPEIDPFCTFPPFCDATQDPIFGGLAGGAP